MGCPTSRSRLLVYLKSATVTVMFGVDSLIKKVVTWILERLVGNYVDGLNVTEFSYYGFKSGK